MQKGHWDRKSRTEEIEETFQEKYPEVQYAYVQFLSEHLADCSRAFDGDLQQLLILAILGQVYITNFKRAGGSPFPDATTGVTASRLADVCRIPRETVRRKLKRLEEKNLIRQDGEQFWTLVIENGATTARKTYDGLNSRALTKLARLHAALERMTARPSDVAPALGAVQAPSSVAQFGRR